MSERTGRVRRWFRLLGVAGVAAFVLGLAWFGAALISVRHAARHDGRRTADAIIVLGAAQYNGVPSPVLEGRLDRAIELYKAGLAGTVVVTGGRQPGDRFTEATASANYLSEHGVPDAAILREVRGRSSYESIAATAAFLKKRGVSTVVLVSDGYHAARIVGIADEVGLDATASPVATSATAAETTRELKEAGAVAIGRVIGYRRLSHLIDT